MAGPSAAKSVLDREFLAIRSRLIDVAAMLDRIDRSQSDASNDPRIAQIRRSLEVLLEREPNRAERVQMEFSLPYQDDWRQATASGSRGED